MGGKQMKEDIVISCRRCHGLLVPIPPLFWSSISNYQPSVADDLQDEAWKCLNCGECVDAIILSNRKTTPQPIGRHPEGRQGSSEQAAFWLWP